MAWYHYTPILLAKLLFGRLLAASGSFDASFYMIQGVELVAGAVNIVLMGLNIRDGFLLAGRMRKKRGLVTYN